MRSNLDFVEAVQRRIPSKWLDTFITGGVHVDFWSSDSSETRYDVTRSGIRSYMAVEYLE